MNTPCQHCQSATKKFGRTHDGRQRYRCLTCRKISSERRARPLGEMRLPVERALLVLQLLVRGRSVRAIERLTGTEKKTILRLLVQVGDGCERCSPRRSRGSRSRTSRRRAVDVRPVQEGDEGAEGNHRPGRGGLPTASSASSGTPSWCSRGTWGGGTPGTRTTS